MSTYGDYSDKESTSPRVQARSTGSLNPATETRPSHKQLQSYKKTGGAADGAGNDYEHKMLTLVFLRLLATRHEFLLASNMEAAGLFDDIVMRYREQSDGRWHVAYLQLKHKQKRTIPKQAFLGLEGDFSLVKYCASYVSLMSDKMKGHTFDNHQLIIFTNADLADSLVCEVESDWLLDTGGKTVSFKAGGEVSQGLCEWVDIKEALTELHGQVEGKSEEVVRNKIKQVLQEAEYKNAGITTCTADLLKTPTLVKLKGVLKILEPVKDKDTYSSFLSKLQVYTNQVHESKLDAKVKQQVGKVWKCSVDLEIDAMLHVLQAKVKSWWQKDNFYLTQDSPLWLGIIKSQVEAMSKNTIRRLTEFDMEFEDSSLQILYKRINEMSGAGGILNLRVDSRSAASSLRVHQALAKFRPNEVVLHVNMKALLEREDDVLSAWTTQWCRLLVVECDSDLDQSQAERVGGKILKVIKIQNGNKMLVLIAPKERKLNLLLKDTDSYVRFNDNFMWNDLTEKAKKIFLSDRIDINGKLSSHSLSAMLPDDKRFFNKVDLEVISQYLLKDVSCGKHLPELGKFFVNRRLQKSDDDRPFVVNSLSDVREKVALLVAEPGMGKSTLITHLANSAKKEDSEAWIVHITLNDCVQYLKDIDMDTFNELTAKRVLEQAALKSPNRFEKLLFRALTHKLVVFVDGVDEVCPHYEQQVFKLLDHFKDMNFSRLWVASRPVFQAKLERTLQVTSMHLVAFSEEDRNEFFNKMWIANVPTMSSEKCSEITERLLTLLTDSLGEDNPILGVPLMAVMIAEIFQERLFPENEQNNEFTRTDRFHVINLYSIFIRKKFDLYCVEKKKTSNRELAANIEDEETLLHQMHHQHRLAALRVLFSCEEIAGLQFEGKDKFDQDLATYLIDVSDGRDKLGIIDNVIDGVPHFVHRSFAEYFAASWLALNFQNNKRFIERIIFDPAYKLVSEMFHRSLTKNHPLQDAVLNRDLEAMKSLLCAKSNKADVDELDAGGRTPLHLAVLLSGTDQNPDHVTIVEYLIQKQNAKLEVTDDVLCWSPLRYAEWARAWKALEMLLNKVKGSWDLIQHQRDWPEPDPQLILDAARDADVSVVRYLVEERGGKVDSRGTEGETMFHRAAEGGNTLTLKLLYKKMLSFRFLLSGGFWLDEPNSGGLTAIQKAALRGDYEVVDVLLELKASFNMNSSPNVSKEQLNASLLCAAFAGNWKSVNNLVKMGASVSRKDNKGHTAAWVAMHRGHYHVMDWLLLCEAKLGHRPLHVACERGELEIVSFILSRGDDVEAKGWLGRTPLMEATRSNKLDIMEQLLEKGANVESSDEHGNTPLHQAALLGHKKSVELLLRFGAHVKKANNMSMTALHTAINYKKMDIVMLLLANNRQPGGKLTQVGLSGVTPLVEVAINNDLDGVRDILATFDADVENISKADYINLKDTLGWTVLHFLARLGNEDIIPYLVAQGADQLVRNNDKNTPLHLAAYLQHAETVRVLLAALDEARRVEAVNTPGKNGNSVLLWAVTGGCVECVRLLVEAGGKLTQVNDSGKSSLMVAADCNNAAVIGVLLCGFDAKREGKSLIEYVYMKDTNSESALDMAGPESRKVIENCLAQI